MFNHGCRRFEDDLSGYVSGTLPEDRLLAVSAHVKECPQCQQAADDIAALRSHLSTVASCPAASSSLTSRLQGIAGGDCDQPLYLTSRGRAPLTRRQRVGRRLTQGGVATMVVLVTLVSITLALGREPTAVADPVRTAREEHFLTVMSLSVDEGVGAAMWARERGASVHTVSNISAREKDDSGAVAITADEASGLLWNQRSNVTYSGTQRVWVDDENGSYTASDVRIDEAAGAGASVTALDAEGKPVRSWLVGNSSCCSTGLDRAWSFFTYEDTPVVAGRFAKVLEAREGTNLVARWWVDRVTGVLLWSERYNSSGRPTLIAGFIELEFGTATVDANAEQIPQLKNASFADSAGWCRGLASCPLELAGLPLVAYASSSDGEEPRQRLVYSDGVRAISVSWDRGVLASGRIDDDSSGQPHVAVWQAGDGVVSVVSTGSRELTRQACNELPGEQPNEFTLAQRLDSGWRRLLGDG